MNTLSVFQVWFQLLILLAVEVGIVCIAVALAAHWNGSAVWRRVFCQAGILAVLLVAVCELSGSARGLADWVVEALARKDSRSGPKENPIRPPGPMVTDAFRSKLEAHLAARRQALSESPPVRGEEVASVRSPDRHQVGRSEAKGGSVGNEFAPDGMKALWLWLIWATGTALVLMRALGAHCLLALFRSRRRRVIDSTVLQRVEALATALGMSRKVRVFESARLACPVAFGWCWSTLGLPLDFLVRYKPTEQQAMLAHELAHLAARDPLWCLLADGTAAVLWWHPGVWWLRRQFHHCSELAADEACLLVADGPRALAECLVELGGRMAGTLRLGQLQAAGLRSRLGQRVQRLLRLEGHAWAPPCRGTALLTAFGPLALTVLVVLCTAWATPQALTKGNGMRTVQLNWKRSLATVALLSAFNASSGNASAVQPEQPTASAPAPTPDENRQPAAPSVEESEARRRAEDAFRRRYGLTPRPATADNRPAEGTKRGAGIEAKLKEIVLPEVQFDNVPLSEVVKWLSDTCRKQDPKKQGINFLVNPNPPPELGVSVPTSIDATTGLPTAPPVESIDINSVAVRIPLPLRNVTMKDALDAVMKVAERPIQYSVEDYGVVISLGREAIPRPALLGHPQTAPEPLVVRTYKVDTNTFVAGLQNAFDMKIESGPGEQSNVRTRKIQAALRELLTQLGVSPSSIKSVFYNDLTGVVMVRATPDDQDLVAGVIQTLGGLPAGTGGGGFGMTSPALEPARVAAPGKP